METFPSSPSMGKINRLRVSFFYLVIEDEDYLVCVLYKLLLTHKDINDTMSRSLNFFIHRHRR